MQARTLATGFLDVVARTPAATALVLGAERTTYEALFRRAAALAATLPDLQGPPLTACLGHRSPTGYAAPLAALLRGHGYVPLDPAAPPARTRSMLQRSGCGALIVAPEGARAVVDVCQGTRPLVILVPDRSDVGALAARLPGHTVLGAHDLAAPDDWRGVEVPTDAVANLLFTSGSTGRPKGVPVTHANLLHFLDAAQQRYGLGVGDRVSQMFDLVFDLHGFDLWATWSAGATLCSPGVTDRLLPGAWIRREGLTVWFSVPSVGMLMMRAGALQPGLFPGLRATLFCGEALRADLAAAWAAAAPHGVVDNLYGPTEVTLCCTVHRWSGSGDEARCEAGVVPIGRPLPGLEALVVGPDLRPVATGATGELILSGPQVTGGYLDDPERTRAAFVVPPGRRERFYRTGDRVRHVDPLVFLGRDDQQVQIRGHRVELGEVEAALRSAPGVEEAVAIAWPPTVGGADGVVAFVVGDASAVPTHVAGLLPTYMRPRRIVVVDALPHNANGKIDRGALRETLTAAL